MGRFGGDGRGRTGGLLRATQALSQLSYTPERWRLRRASAALGREAEVGRAEAGFAAVAVDQGQ